MNRKPQPTAPMNTLSTACHALGRAARRLQREDDAVTAIEYGLLAALIAVVCVVALQSTGTSLGALYDYWCAAVSAAL